MNPIIRINELLTIVHTTLDELRDELDKKGGVADPEIFRELNAVLTKARNLSILQMHLNNIPNHRIAKALDISDARVSQILTETKAELRDKFGSVE